MISRRSLALALALASAPAAAQTLEIGTEDRGRNPYATPQNFALELRGGPWTPNVDSEFGGAGNGPYHEIFGDEPRVHFSLEVDWQLLRINPIGSLGLGLQGGWAWASWLFC